MTAEAEFAAQDCSQRRALYYMGRPIRDMSRDELLAVVEHVFEDFERMKRNVGSEQRMQDVFRKARKAG